MKKIIRLTERDLVNIVKRVISEEGQNIPVLGIKIKKLIVKKKPDGTIDLDGSSVVPNINDENIMINEISNECGDGSQLTDPKCRVAFTTPKYDLMCLGGNCSQMK